MAKPDKPKKAASPKKGRAAHQFKLSAPFAKTVSVAGSFTRWEQAPIDLTCQPDGTWTVETPLPEGRHEYRFIVDGRWEDDPDCVLRAPNIFGTHNCVIEV